MCFPNKGHFLRPDLYIKAQEDVGINRCREKEYYSKPPGGSLNRWCEKVTLDEKLH